MYLNLEDDELDQYVYRIIPYDRFIELFKTSQNTLVKPNVWEDKFENFALKSKINFPNGDSVELDVHERMYGQCWTREKSSDAMWRIYSPDRNGIRIRTTINNLIDSIGIATVNFSYSEYCVGKVLYKSEREIIEDARNSFDENGRLTFGSLFRSLLIKRKAFQHENEIRVLHFDWREKMPGYKLFKYEIDPHSLISQVMIDPRIPYKEFLEVKSRIIHETGYQGDIKRSLLYKLPEPLTIVAQQNITSGS